MSLMDSLSLGGNKGMPSKVEQSKVELKGLCVLVTILMHFTMKHNYYQLFSPKRTNHFQLIVKPFHI